MGLCTFSPSWRLLTIILLHFTFVSPNTESTTQRKQGLKADRPDFKVLIGDKEASFGEVTGRSQRADKAKNGWDLWRLVRFGKSVLDEGAPMVPLIQVIYDEGIIYRHFVRIRGVMVLAEVGVFTVPMHLNNVGALQASLPVLNWYQVMMMNTTDKVHCCSITEHTQLTLILSLGGCQVAGTKPGMGQAVMEGSRPAEHQKISLLRHTRRR